MNARSVPVALMLAMFDNASLATRRLRGATSASVPCESERGGG